MTGTLDCLTSAQTKLLEEYKFQNKTFLPSTFQKKPAQQETMEVVVGEWNDFFLQVRRDIEQKLISGRAILVIFKDINSLRRFAEELNKQKPNINQYHGFLELLDEMSPAERQSNIQKAIRPFTVTLMTRAYGRGTDFVCFDKALVKYGGVHVLTTFLPEDESEEKQIFGRTCRQDDPGS
ncbi:hypothetical protein GUITHDRAFT_71190, partial [Guillardia theta CCMP2712]